MSAPLPPEPHPRLTEALPHALSAATGGRPGDAAIAAAGALALGRLRLIPAHEPKLRCALADAARAARVGEIPLGDGRVLIPDLDSVFGREDLRDDEAAGVRALLLARATLETDAGKRALAKAERRRLVAIGARVRLMLTQAAPWSWRAIGTLAGQLELAAHFHALPRHAHSELSAILAQGELAAVLARGIVPDAARFDLSALRALARRHSPVWPLAEGWAARDAALDAVTWDFAPHETARLSA